jgi:hypothetical protein
MNDFSSYEFVSLTLDSAMTQADNLKERIDKIRSSLKFSEEGIERAKGMPSLLREGGFYESQVSIYQEAVERDRRILSELETLLASLGEQANEIACNVYSYTYRENNEVGAKFLRSGKLYLTPELEVKRKALDSGSELLTCNELPAYFEILKEL